MTGPSAGGLDCSVLQRRLTGALLGGLTGEPSGGDSSTGVRRWSRRGMRGG